jgi:hypothetical protein
VVRRGRRGRHDRVVRRLVPLLALLGALAFATPARAADRPLRMALREAAARVDWGNLAPHERVVVLRRWNRAQQPFDAILARIAPELRMQRTLGTEIAGGNFMDHTLGEDGRPWRVNLAAAVLTRGAKLHAHLTLHELGHVVDGVLADDAWREAFVAGLTRSPLWQPCIPMPPGSSSRCVRSNEIITDQFAFWATARREVRSSYWVPPLLHRAELGAWFARLLESEPVAAASADPLAQDRERDAAIGANGHPLGGR